LSSPLPAANSRRSFCFQRLGEIDILLRLPPARFPIAVEALKQHFQIKQPDNWSPEFASLGDGAGYRLPVGVQVVVKDSSADFLLFLRDYFVENPRALRDYNQVKASYSNGSNDDYWKAKNEFLSRILASRNT
jgi:GrpB-like predicted nucleotidyltransferase (UPF0157 family)